MTRFNHSAETDRIIAEGYRKGDPVNWIAKKLRCTKNVVIGRARRIGVSNPQGAIWASSKAEGHNRFKRA